MADVTRQRSIEYYNPRPMILGLCFFWGIAMGFCLFYFSPPKQMMRQEARREDAPVLPAVMSDRERRHLDTPNIAPVAPAPEEAQDNRPRLETMDLELPPPLLTTDGGLTGRTARPLALPPVTTTVVQPTPAVTPLGPVQQPQYRTPPPPPIPELFPY